MPDTAIQSLVPRLRQPQAVLLSAGFLAVLIYAAAAARDCADPALMAQLLAVFVAAIASSIAGFAFAAICGALLFHLMADPVRVVQIMMVCSIANQSLAVWSARHAIDLRAMRPFLIGGAVGVPLGVTLLLHAKPAANLRALGCILIAWTIHQLLRKPLVLERTSAPMDIVYGAAGGLLGGFSGFAGALIAIRCGLKGWDKNRQRGVYQPIIIFTQLSALVWIMALRPGHTAIVGGQSLAFVPCSLLGTYYGLGIFKRLSDRQFTNAINATLMVSGIALIV